MGGQKCIIKTCTNSTTKKQKGEIKDVIFHKFPTNVIRQNSWLINIQTFANQMGQVHERSIICSDHFKDSDYVNKPDGKKILSKTAEPTLFGSAIESYSEMDKLFSNSEIHLSKTSSESRLKLVTGIRQTAKPIFPLNHDLIRTDQPTTVNSVLQPGKIHPSKPVTVTRGIQPGQTISQKSVTVTSNLQSGKIISAKPVSSGSQPTNGRIRYPGDITDLPNMSRQQLEKCVQMCKKKVESQALTIEALRRQVRAKDRQIATLRCLVKELKKKFALSEHAAESIESRRCLKAKSEGKKVYLALMVDEMSIRKQVIWNHNLKKFVGYVDYGSGTAVSEHSEEATDALVFLANTVNESWKLPLAHYFTNKCTGEEKANILRELLFEINETGAEVMSLTFDGASNNISMATAFGVDFSNPSLDKEYSFKNPATGKAIYIILDICHMIKLVRNILGLKWILYDKDDKEIKWNYIVELEKLQKANGLHLATKLTQQHINFHNSKMKVRLATQTLSNSVADALTYCCCNKYAEFKECGPTITYVRLFNQIFDAMNSRKFKGTEFKRPLNESTYDEFIQLFRKAEKYIKELQILQPVYRNKEIIGYVKKPILSTACKTGFLGFIVGMSSFKNIAQKYILETKELKYLLAFKFSQDHLETLFSVIRSRGGFNNNPNCVQFKTAFKRLLMRNELQSSLNGNCLSRDSRINHVEAINNSIRTSQISCEQRLQVEDEDDIDVVNIFTDRPIHLSEYAKDVISHVAGYVERHLKNTIKCSECLICLNTEDVVYGTLTIIKNNGGLIYPQQNIYKICKIAEQEIKCTNFKDKNFFDRLSIKILRSVLSSHIFCNVKHSCSSLNDDHKALLIKSVVDYYIKIRCFHLAKQVNLKNTNVFVRKKLTKLIHFKNQ